jgi:multimeric flavodoxin WrbA
MKILAVNGSPRGKDGNTEQMLQPFLKGAGSAGANVEVIYLKEKKINHCLGCLTCWNKTPGVCVHKDDMPELLEKRLQADMVVYATPLYAFTVTGLMKDFMDRGLPLARPNIVRQGDNFGHPRRHNEEAKKIVLISNCGFPDRRIFSGLVETFRHLCFCSGTGFAGEILCPAGALLTVPRAREHIQWYLDACEAAGREVVSQGGISPAIKALLERDIIDPETYTININAYIENIFANQPQ